MLQGLVCWKRERNEGCFWRIMNNVGYLKKRENGKKERIKRIFDFKREYTRKWKVKVPRKVKPR
jgi:hypothetical protein